MKNVTTYSFNKKVGASLIMLALCLGSALAVLLINRAPDLIGQNSLSPTLLKEYMIGAAVASVSGCQLSFTMTPAAAQIVPDGENTYALLVKNNGAEPCIDAAISVYYEQNEVFATSSPYPSSGGYYWKIGGVDPGAVYSITLTTKQTGSVSAIHNEACLSASNSPDVCVQNTVAVSNAAPAISTTQSPVMPTANTSQASAESVVALTPSNNKEYGVWVWDSPSVLGTSGAQRVIASAAEQGFNVIYITIDDYLAIFSLPEGVAKEAKKTAYMDALESFITLAEGKGIAVHAEGGWRDWAKTTVRWKAHALLGFAQNYNAVRTHKLAGFQFDVEPYLLPEYEKNKGKVLTDFVAFVDEIVTKNEKNSLKLTFVIPHFYDKKQKWTPMVTFKGQKKYAFSHMLDSMSRLPQGDILIMAYRNFSDGADGSVTLARAEIDEASAMTSASKIRIIVAQETGDVEPAYVTFAGTSREKLFAEVGKINTAFAASTSFGGIAIHYLDPFLELP